MRLRPPSLPYLSNLTGTWVTAEEAVSPAYWVRHLRETVRFGAAIDELRREPNRIFLEVGPGRGLRSLLPLAISSLGAAADSRPDPELLLTALGRLWLAGIEVDWAALHGGERRRRLPLPTYPFERRRYWIEPGIEPGIAPGIAPGIEPGIEPGLAVGPGGAGGAGAAGAGGELRAPAPAAGAGAEVRRPELPNPYVPPAGERERAVAALWEEMLGMAGIGAEDDFFDLGGHSMLALHLSSRFEERFGVRLPLAALAGRVTVRLLAGLLPQATPRISRLRVAMQRGGARPLLWCVHPIGGTTLCYRWLARQLGEDQPFIALQAAGLEGDEPPGATVEAMAARYLEEVLAEQPSGPYLLAGWSFGGLVAYEMSRQLVERGAEVARLVLIDTWLSAAGAAPAVAPGSGGTAAASRLEPAEIADTLGGKRLVALMGWFFSDLAAGAGRDPAPVSGDGLAAAAGDPEAFFQRCLERAVQAGALPSRAVGERLFAVFRAHVVAASRYVPRPLAIPAVLIKAATLPASPAAAELGLLPPGAGDPRQRWHDLIAGPLEVQVVAGDHYTMLRPPHVTALAACLRRSLESSCLALQAASLP